MLNNKLPEHDISQRVLLTKASGVIMELQGEAVEV